MGKQGPKPVALAPDMAAFRGTYLDAFKLAVTMDTSKSKELIKEGIFECWKGRKPGTLNNPLICGDREHPWVRLKNTGREQHEARTEFLGVHTPRDTREMLVRFLGVAMTEEAHDADKRMIAEAHRSAGEILTHPWRELRLPEFSLHRGYFHLQSATALYGDSMGRFRQFVSAVADIGAEKHGGVMTDFHAARDGYQGVWEKLTTKVMEERFARAENAASPT